MITPNEIQEKIAKLYPEAVDAWIRQETTFFPRRIRANLSLPATQSETIACVEKLRGNAKESIGYGYSIEWEQIRSRSKGENRFPQAIYIETLEDLLRVAGKVKEFRLLEKSVSTLRRREPKLEPWLGANWKKLIAIGSQLELLLDVVAYLVEHPRPGCFPRELPLKIPTKLVGQNQSLLSEWFDILLPPHAIDFGCDRRNFARRYGFQEVRDHVMMRILDPQIVNELRLPTAELSLRPIDIDRLPIENAQVIIVENKVNLLTLPFVSRGIAFGGLGHGVTQLYSIGWFERTSIRYWGDLDVEGFAILAGVRRRFPQTESFLMSTDVLHRYRTMAIEGRGRSMDLPGELLPDEAEVFLACRDNNLRLEQEHVTQEDVMNALS